MKNLKYILIATLLSSSIVALAQTSPEVTKKIVAEKNYVFVANSATPMATADISKVLNAIPGAQGGGTIALTGSQYDLKVTKDSVIAYLPYYGRAYTAPMNPSESGIKFTSKDFSYKESKNKKGVYSIQINTKDVKAENYKLTLTISENGYASLTVISVNRQPINFNGVTEEAKK
ncbi:DUF4251 domain-containing protein [Pedobacter changchengzhani]|uniref:DUF4251 domain-containing protein n=1 Tax=Pedobacter changchengzhani TaxID=2529274 RepID=A0A4R5MQ40_9SPHI|nr:DUF4251 domain-containing protein [Pedobacter changchengzhani]TDG37990.1 DUF4251 domain-containing protein [Pedobacter changchengzhani]